MPTISGHNFIIKIRNTVAAFCDIPNETVRDLPDRNYLQQPLTKEGIITLRNFAKLIAYTDFISDKYVKEYLTSGRESYESVAKRLNTDSNNLRKRVFYYCSVSKKRPGKIVRIFGDQFLTDIISFRRKDLEEIDFKLNRELAKQLGLQDVQKDIDIVIPGYKQTDELSSTEFDSFIDVIRPYTKTFKKQAVKNLTREQCGYFHYLVNNQHSLKGEDAERFDLILSMVDGTAEDIVE